MLTNLLILSDYIPIDILRRVERNLKNDRLNELTKTEIIVKRSENGERRYEMILKNNNKLANFKCFSKI